MGAVSPSFYTKFIATTSIVYLFTFSKFLTALAVFGITETCKTSKKERKIINCKVGHVHVNRLN